MQTNETTYLTQNEAAQFLRLSARTLERWRVEGTGPRFCRFGRRVVYARLDLIEWAGEHAFLSTAEAASA